MMSPPSTNSSQNLIPGFLMGGFECSTHRLGSGRRLDLIASTKHDKFVREDYQRLREIGVQVVRDGLRWHKIEPEPGQYDFSSVLPMLQAAEETGLKVIWDVCHYGWPDDVAIFKPAFVERMGKFTQAFVRMHLEVTGRAPWIAPVNEISFFAWAGGQIAMFNPGSRGRGDDLKAQLVRATIASIEGAWEVSRETRIVHTDPLIRVLGDPQSKRAQNRADAYHQAQYQSFDMISGRWKPELGGKPEYLDIIGLNYYPANQWMVHKSAPGKKNPPQLRLGHPAYKPLRELLAENWQRYQRPLFLAETGTEGDFRPKWFRYVCDEVAAAIEAGVPVEGLCWYPIVNHPGWTNHRHCHNGLWDYADKSGEREAAESLLEEWGEQKERFDRLLAGI
ncbi:MAG: beta-galactosidase [Chthoniobacterales bacterium]